MALIFRRFSFPAFQLLSKFPKFFSLWLSFSSRDSCYSCSFSSFLALVLTYRHKRGRASRYGFTTESCATGKIWEAVICTVNCQILDELSNSGKT
nr:MAG TPA: S-adenosylmethionine decarboxylase beta chain [Caudoviricetes sp.]